MIQPTIRFRLIVRAAAALGFFAGAAAIASNALIPSGTLSTTTDLQRAAPFVSAPKPSKRLGDAAKTDGAVTTPVIDDPVYVDLAPPATFDRITATLRYANPDQRTVELGALSSSLDSQFDMRPLETRVTDRIVAPASPPAYSPLPAERDLPVSLRGHQRMLVFVRGEPLSFTFTVQDMNRAPGADPAFVTVERGVGGPAIASAKLDDDGDAADDQRASTLRTIAVEVPHPAEDAYQIEFTTTSDLFIRDIRTHERKLVFLDAIDLGDVVGYRPHADPVTVWTDGSALSARTPHAEGIQTVAVGGAPFDIAEPNVRYMTQIAPSALAAVTAPKRDLFLQTDGAFALSKDDYFDPRPFEPRRQPVIPERDGGFSVASATFDVKNLARTKDGAYRFAISAPGIRVASLTFTMRRSALTLGDIVPRFLELFSPPSAPLLISSTGRSFGESPE